MSGVDTVTMVELRALADWLVEATVALHEHLGVSVPSPPPGGEAERVEVLRDEVARLTAVMTAHLETCPGRAGQS